MRGTRGLQLSAGSQHLPLYFVLNAHYSYLAPNAGSL